MAGAHVIMACRNVEGANRIASEWTEDTHNSKDILVEVTLLYDLTHIHYLFCG